MDFFTVPTLRFRTLHVYFILHHDRRTILHVNVTAPPTSPGVAQQIGEAFMARTPLKYVIHDRDSMIEKGVVRTAGKASPRSARPPGTEPIST